MGLAPSPRASSTQDIYNLWSTSVESMRESTGFRVRSVANALAALAAALGAGRKWR